MDQALRSRCERFLANRDTLRKAFPWENPYLHAVCAGILTQKNQTAEVDRLHDCRDLLRARTGFFSNFRGIAQEAMITLLSLEPAPQEELDQGLRLYDALKDHFRPSQYLPLAALLLADQVEERQYGAFAARTRAIYNGMKEAHCFLTGVEDSVFAALLALSPRPVEALIAETEACYDRLKHRPFGTGQFTQTLSHVLALGEGSAQEKCDRTLALYDALKDRGRKYSTGHELGTLGLLTLVPGEVGALAEEVVEVDHFLSQQKGYGLMGVGKAQRLMHGVMLTAGYILDQNQAVLGAAAVSTTVSLIVAQEVALFTVVAAGSAAGIAASSTGQE